ncbi:uncharacterized protein LOC116245748 [Nymphaea colorata]|nr:uncharacterized protein LOC116245748 [Nymphaea colorata]XP_031473134.1 uncharacterized protein LOC116245748 [Nymphaea colorata]XP_031473136.1 uncharacterized protein LOC116245748 [Nymphaea colorata]
MCPEGVGFVAVMAVSGSILYAALRAHRQLVSDFKKRIEFEFSVESSPEHGEPVKKRVTFADDTADPCSDGKEYRKRRSTVGKRRGRRARNEEESGDRPVEIPADMPPNRMALYRGLREERAVRETIH